MQWNTHFTNFVSLSYITLRSNLSITHKKGKLNDLIYAEAKIQNKIIATEIQISKSVHHDQTEFILELQS